MPKGTIPKISIFNIPPPYIADGVQLPANWRSLPARWVLDPNYDDHCDACTRYAGYYTSYGNLIHHTQGGKPGYFPMCAIRGTRNNYYDMVVACGEECSCWIELLVEGTWQRIVLDK